MPDLSAECMASIRVSGAKCSLPRPDLQQALSGPEATGWAGKVLGCQVGRPDAGAPRSPVGPLMVAAGAATASPRCLPSSKQTPLGRQSVKAAQSLSPATAAEEGHSHVCCGSGSSSSTGLPAPRPRQALLPSLMLGLSFPGAAVMGRMTGRPCCKCSTPGHHITLKALWKHEDSRAVPTPMATREL